jgi:ferric-dicitrate binding protein FerR (iron transport regulator)
MEASSQNEKDKALLRKYLIGNCTPEEKERVEAWYNSFDRSPLPEAKLEGASLRRVRKSVLAEVQADHARGRTLHWPIYLRIAAAFILFSAISLIVYLNIDRVGDSSQQYQALNSEQKTVTLADGSVVTLNSGSVLQVSPDFGEDSRKVSLTGEAYFEVAKDTARPFIVSTGVISTRVLGTAFNVQAYGNEEDLTVTVAEGKVSVDQEGAQQESVNLSPGVTPGKQLVYDRSTQHAMVIPADAEQIGAWRKGVTYFNNESIPAIARKLERKFNLKIDVTEKGNPDCLYTLRISNETLPQALQLLTSVSGITYTYHDQNHLTLNTTACK